MWKQCTGIAVVKLQGPRFSPELGIGLDIHPLTIGVGFLVSSPKLPLGLKVRGWVCVFIAACLISLD